MPAHRFRAVDQEHPAAALRLEIGGVLHGAQLPHVQHGTCDGVFQAHRVGNDCPHVRIRLQNKRHALDGRCVGPLASLRESLLDEGPNIGEQPDLPARLALAAEIIWQPLAVGRLREHSGQREFPDSARAGEKHRVRHALGGQHAAKRGDDARVAEKIGEAHKYIFLFNARPRPGTERAFPRPEAPPGGFPRANAERPKTRYYSRCAPSSLPLPSDRK
jgi:hypothetical protein